jgi:hypothetical protein
MATFDQALSPRLGQRTKSESTVVYRADSDANMPASPFPGQLVFRTDFKILVTYDGTKWVSAHGGSAVTDTGASNWMSLKLTTAVNLTNGGWTRLSGMGLVASAGTMTTVSGDIVCGTAGWYMVHGSVAHVYSAASTPIGVTVDIADSENTTTWPLSVSPTTDGGGAYQLTTTKPGANGTTISTSGPLYVDAGQHIRLWAYQNTGTNPTSLTARDETQLKAFYLGR